MSRDQTSILQHRKLGASCSSVIILRSKLSNSQPYPSLGLLANQPISVLCWSIEAPNNLRSVKTVISPAYRPRTVKYGVTWPLITHTHTRHLISNWQTGAVAPGNWIMLYNIVLCGNLWVLLEATVYYITEVLWTEGQIVKISRVVVPGAYSFGYGYWEISNK